jgi:very-short-patch-repair endonuclease
MGAGRADREKLFAHARAGVLSRAQLAILGWDRDAVAREVRALRWALHGRQTVAVHTGPLPEAALRWRALWESGRWAALDGVSALQAAGLTGFVEESIHVSIGHRDRLHRVEGVRVHRVVRRSEDELSTNGLRSVRPAVAAVRAAQWAVSDRQAALLLVMPVQQRLVTGARLLAAAEAVPGRTRRHLIQRLARDIASGAESLGELDFAVLCRRRGLPEPSRQVVRRRPGGVMYLDVAWDDIGLVVEIDGSQHSSGLAATDDSFRANLVTLGDHRVLRMTLVGLRLRPDEFMEQVVAAHQQLGSCRRLAG